MATSAQIKAFIEEIAPLAQKAYKELGKVKPSVCIGMACVECGYGTSGSVKYNSLLGQKVGTGKTATKYWDGKFFTSKTGEEYTVGVHTTITAAFRAYSSKEQCIFNYYELLNTGIYSRVLAESDFAEQMMQIKQCGYMTSSDEVNSVLQIIRKNGLTRYDDVTGVTVPDDKIQICEYQNGSTPEPVYADSELKTKIGQLDPRERCTCFGLVNGRAVVLYDTKTGKKVGFAKWTGGIKA